MPHIELSIPPELSVALTELSALLPGRVTPPNKFHITLAYLGKKGLPPDITASLLDVLLQFVQRTPAVAFTLGGITRLTAIKEKGAQPVAVLVYSKGLLSLCAQLREDLQARFGPSFVDTTFPFNPHITLTWVDVSPNLAAVSKKAIEGWGGLSWLTPSLRFVSKETVIDIPFTRTPLTESKTDKTYREAIKLAADAFAPSAMNAEVVHELAAFLQQLYGLSSVGEVRELLYAVFPQEGT